MKIILLGGGTGGHFYPLIAVARALYDIKESQHLVSMNIKILGSSPLDRTIMLKEGLVFEQYSTGKFRRYFSIKNILDIPKVIKGIFQTMWRFSKDPPDIIFSKGGYDSFPALFTARLYKIPVIIHESDVIPGSVNKWSAKFARRIGISFAETSKYFPAYKVALTGNPIRKNILGGNADEAKDIFKLEEKTPVILILGGSLGSEAINDMIISILPDLIKKYQVIHQTGNANFKLVVGESKVVLERASRETRSRYHPFPTLDESHLRNASKVSTLVVSRSGGGAIAEIAAWGLPSILVPLPSSAQDHARHNAYNYAREGACDVLEQKNLTPHMLSSQIDKIMMSKEIQDKMKKAAQSFAKIDAADRIADELIKIGVHD